MQVATEKKDKIESLAINLLAALKSAIEINDEQPLQALSHVSALNDLDAAIVFLASSVQHRPIATRYFAQSNNNRQINYLKNQFIQELNQIIKKQQRDPSENPNMALRNYAEYLSQVCKIEGSLSHEVRQSLAEAFKQSYHLPVEVDDFEAPIICKAISDSLKQLGFFEEAFYFGYFAYVNAKGNQKVSDLIDLLEIAVKLEKNSFDECKHFLFIEILKLAPKGDIKSGGRLIRFMVNENRFTKHEKHILLYAILLMPVSVEDKIITLINGLSVQAVYIDQVLLLHDLIMLPHNYSATIRKMVTSILSESSAYKVIFYMLDETLAKRSGQVSFLLKHNKITTSEYISRLSTINAFTKSYKQTYLVNDPVFDNIFAACICKNYDTIDHILNFVLTNTNARTLAWVRFLAEFCAPILDHIKTIWLKNNLKIAMLFLCSCNTAILKEIDDNLLIKIISTYQQIIIVEFAHNLKDRLHFLKEFLVRLQQLPNGAQVCREFLTQSSSDKVEALLETVIEGYEDNLALYLLQLGARPNTTGLHGTKLIAHALQHGCTKFVSHLVALDQSLTYLKTEIVEIVRKYPLFIREIEPFSQKEAFVYLLKETQEIANNPQKKLGQIMRTGHFVKKLSNSTDKENKELYTLYSLSFNCYPLLYQLLLKANLATHCTPYFSKESASLDCQLLVLKSFNFLSLLEKKEPGEQNLAAQLEKIVEKSPESTPMLINFFTYWLPITTANTQLELILSVYFIFRNLVLSANINAPALMLLMLKLPMTQYASNLDKSWPADKQLAWICFQLIASALNDSQSQFKNKFLLLIAPSGIINLVIMLGKKETFLNKLEEFLIALRKEDQALIADNFSELKKIFKVLSAKRFENALISDDNEEYKKLINEFSDIFENEKFSHVITLIKLHTNKNSEILTFLLKQDQKTKSILNANQRKIVLETIIENDNAVHLQLAIENGLIDSRSLPQSTNQHTLYALALQKEKSSCADILLPNFISGELVLLTAKHGSNALFQRALNANSSFEVVDDNPVCYEEFEQACLGNKDKLTIIAMTRLQNRARFKDKFPEKLKRFREKVKTNNPNGDELFRQFKHQVDVLKSYSITLTMQTLTKNDYTACHLSLRELMHQSKICGKTNIQRNLNEAEYGQIIALLSDLEKNVNLEDENQELSQDLIISYLQWIESIQDKPTPANVIQDNTVTTVARKKPPRNKSGKQKNENQSSTTPLVVVPVEKSLYFYQPVKPKDALNEEKSSEALCGPRITETIQEINKEIEDRFKNIVQIVTAIQNQEEQVAFNEESCNKLLNEFRALKSLFTELDDNLDVESNYYEYKLQLDLLKFDHDFDQESKMQVTLIAKQFLNPKSKTPSSVAPIDNVQKPSKTPSFFKPAIMLDDINRRCEIRQAEVKLLLDQQNIDFDNLFYRVFRLINALSSIYRPALRLRHFLIHRFYLVETEHLLQLAKAIVKLNFAERKSFLPIEQSSLYQQAELFLNPFLKKGKQEACDFTAILKTILTKLKNARGQRQEDKMLWLVTQIGELAKQTTIREVLTIRTDTDYDCRALRNQIAHDDYPETNKADEQVAFHGLVNQLIEADPANLMSSMSLRA